MADNRETYRGYEISTDGSSFIVEGDTVYIQHDISAGTYSGPCGYRDPQPTPLDAARKYIDIRLKSN